MQSSGQEKAIAPAGDIELLVAPSSPASDAPDALEEAKDNNLQVVSQSNSPDSRKKQKKIAFGILLVCAFGIAGYFLYEKYFKNSNEIDDEETTDSYMKFLIETIAAIQDMNNGHALIPSSFYMTLRYLRYVFSTTPFITDPNIQEALQTERILATTGQNIYDAATWQIAMSLAGKHELATNQNNFLSSGHTADRNLTSTLRAMSDPHKAPNATFTYGSNQTKLTGKAAYFFRMIGPKFLNKDPMAGVDGIPLNAEQEWKDWKPITGENAWAAFIGPTQAAYQKYSQQAKNIPLSELSLSHGMLTAVKSMQSPIGAIYYTTTNVAPNQGTIKVNPYTVSLENNFSMLAGLNMYRTVLKAHAGEKFPDGVSVDDEIKQLDSIINKMLDFIKNYAFDSTNGYFYQGGYANDPTKAVDWVPTVKPFALDVQTWGVTVLGAPTIDGWFGVGTAYKIWQVAKEQAGYYVDGELAGVGFSDQPEPVSTPSINVTVTNNNGKAQDGHRLHAVALWQDNSSPLSLTSTPIVFNETANVVVPFQSTTNSPLRAVQFIDENFNQVAIAYAATLNENAAIVVNWENAGVTINNYAPRHDVLSSEWTFGAINMAKTLAAHYQQINQAAYAANLLKDAASMGKGVLCLTTDNYFKPECNPHIPFNASVIIPEGQVAFLYANKRFLIPFGWMANPVPSTCATSWAVMDAKDFNPFSLGGSRSATNWTTGDVFLQVENYSVMSYIRSGVNYFVSLVKSDQAPKTESERLTAEIEQVFQQSTVNQYATENNRYFGGSSSFLGQQQQNPSVANMLRGGTGAAPLLPAANIQLR